jgi:hypothetical protein
MSQTAKTFIECTFLSWYLAIDMIIIGYTVSYLHQLFVIHWFKGKFYTCIGVSSSVLESIVTRNECSDAGGLWFNKRANFDNLSESMITMNYAFSTEGWLEILNSVTDAVGIDKLPKLNHQEYMGIFVILFIIQCLYIIQSFLAAVCIDWFNQKVNKKRIGDGILVNETQRQWKLINDYWSMQTLKFIPVPPVKKSLLTIKKILESNSYSIFKIILILLYCVITCTIYYQMTEEHEAILWMFSLVYFLFWNFEMI